MVKACSCGLSLFDFKQILVDSGTIVHCGVPEKIVGLKVCPPGTSMGAARSRGVLHLRPFLWDDHPRVAAA